MTATDFADVGYRIRRIRYYVEDLLGSRIKIDTAIRVRHYVNDRRFCLSCCNRNTLFSVVVNLKVSFSY